MARSLLLVLLVCAGCLEPRELEPLRHTSNCTTCHGSPVRSASELNQSAPPFDVAGNSDARSPGVGAHLVHLTPNEVHAGIVCSECHVVPDATDSSGHADSALPAELTFGSLASTGNRQPSYQTGTCVNTYCHLATTPKWIPSETPVQRCERCHAMPPPPPHPALSECERCHGEVVDAAGVIIATERHVNGVVDVDERCDGCHGSGSLGAPPPDLSGATDVSRIGVGAHAAHLAGGDNSRALACGECHTVPRTAGDSGHLDDATPHAEVIFTLSVGPEPTWSRHDRRCAGGWCHGPSSPAWTEPGPLGCTSCHGMPPAPPHPQMSDCARCHGEVIDAAGSILARERHVDGVVDVMLPEACNACHGDSTSAAPPLDLQGNALTTFAGVGAHRAHLDGSGIARPVPCSECHQVPSEVLSTGHIDTFAPAELAFSGVAKAFGASPSYDGMRCVNSYCHGDQFVFGHDSGGLATEPLWTQVDGTQKQCNSCHGLPPPAPHPPGPSFCSDCHSNVGITLQILDPLSHVDGVVTF